MRDLGSTIGTALRTDTKLSRHRLNTAVSAVRKISFLPEDLITKAMYVRTVAIGGGLYSFEAAHVDEVALRSFGNAIVKMIQPQSYQPCQALVFALAHVGEDLDPNIHILYRRLLMMRRMLLKFPCLQKDTFFCLRITEDCDLWALFMKDWISIPIPLPQLRFQVRGIDTSGRMINHC